MIEVGSGLTEIGYNAFYDCINLKSFPFNEGLLSIGTEAFRGSGLQSVELPSTVTHVGNGAFAGSRISYINFPDGLEVINENVASDCPELMVANLPSALKAIGTDALSSASMVSVNSPALQPASTSGNPFGVIDNLNCALSIPRQSFTPYLLAEYWGAFVGMRNSIDITMPESVEMTYMDEDDYQAMIEDEEAESETPANGRRQSLRVMRRAGVIGNAKGYGKLFNGASLYRLSLIHI